MKRSCSAVISDHLCLHWFWPRSGPLSCLSFVLSLSTPPFYFCPHVCISAVICWTRYASPRLCPPFLICTLLFIFSLFFCSLQTDVSEHQKPRNLTQTAFYTHAQQVLKVMENSLNNPNKSTWELSKTVFICLTCCRQTVALPCTQHNGSFLVLWNSWIWISCCCFCSVIIRTADSFFSSPQL